MGVGQWVLRWGREDQRVPVLAWAGATGTAFGGTDGSAHTVGTCSARQGPISSTPE